MVRRLTFDDGERDPMLEWLVTNGLGGYATGPVCGGLTRRYHGPLIAALPAPHGRIVMVNHLRATVETGRRRLFLDHENQQTWPEDDPDALAPLVEFRLECGLPVWEYEIDGTRIERRLLMPHLQNTTQISYRRLSGSGPLRLELQPMFHVRPHEETLSESSPRPGRVTMTDAGAEIDLASNLPPVRLVSYANAAFALDRPSTHPVQYIEERARGYADAGELWSPGTIAFDLTAGSPANLIVSTESWDTLAALTFDTALEAERARRARLIDRAVPEARTGIAAELVLAADQFVILPATRTEETVLAKAAGDEPRTIVAGYHWFTDWGRDTMISLEGLTIATGRVEEAGDILRMFAHHVKDGLIPNLFPEGERSGLYHTADATLWFFHALDRYVAASGDRSTLQQLLPTMVDIAEHHLRGTAFGIGVDPADGLLRQGADGYQLTWMDAKVDGWVVTPRRGKAVEINALWHSALRLLATWLFQEDRADDSRRYLDAATRARESFNRRFWSDSLGYLLDVVDGENGDDPACRPNQIFAISLPYPVLEQTHWKAVLEVVRKRLVTPVGLRSLAAGHPDYCPKYYGDLRARDAAYHQGTVWAWLIGPYVNAWLKVHPGDIVGARGCLDGFVPHLSQACVGSVSEIFDAESPFLPRGCIAQAWRVAELLRCWVLTTPKIS
jgi:predicted glycogen debranching enzyme